MLKKNDPFFHILNSVLSDNSNKLNNLNITKPSTYTPIFIIGLPRSGSTLLSQLITQIYDIGYINNLVARFWSNPIIGIKLSQEFDLANYKSLLNSSYGVTSLINEPHEFGYYWNQWFYSNQTQTNSLNSNERLNFNFKSFRTSQFGILNTFSSSLVKL